MRKILRIVMLALGVALTGFGVAVATSADLGTTCISSPPFVLNALFPLSFGTWTMIFNVLFVIGQILILRRAYSPWQLLQIPLVSVFGLAIDAGMWCCSFLPPAGYAVRIAECLAGCFLMGIGIATQSEAELIMVPGDALVKVFSRKIRGVAFGTVKIAFDILLVATAALIGLCGTGHIIGIREGTVIAAVAVGLSIRLMQPKIRKATKQLL